MEINWANPRQDHYPVYYDEDLFLVTESGSPPAGNHHLLSVLFSVLHLGNICISRILDT